MPGLSTLARRALTITAAALAGLWGTTAVDAGGLPTKGASGWYDFTLQYSGFPIGKHRITYKNEGEDLILTYDTDVTLTIAFITVAKFNQKIKQVWRGDRLVALDAHTDDGDGIYEVHAEATKDGLMVKGPGGSFVAPANTVPTFYWTPGLLGPAKILDVEQGKLINVKFERASNETISVEGRNVAAEVIRVTGDKTAEFAWTRDNEIVLRELTTKGRRLTFVRDASGVEPPQAAQAPAARK